jgi:hypothetical protein
MFSNLCPTRKKIDRPAVKNILNLIIILQLVFLSSCLQKSTRAGAPDDSQLTGQPKIDTRYGDWASEHLMGKVKSYTDSSFAPMGSPAGVENGELWQVESKLFSDNGLLAWCKDDDVKGGGMGDVEQTYRFQYADNGNVNERIETRRQILGEHKNEFKEYYKYKYDKQKNRVEMDEYMYDTSLFRKYYYKYGDRGKLLEERKYMAVGGPSEGRMFNYDSTGNLVEHSVVKDDIVTDRYVYVNDDKGNVIEEKRIDVILNATEEQYINQYEYDTGGNWIKRVRYRKDIDAKMIPVSIDERTISYYK